MSMYTETITATAKTTIGYAELLTKGVTQGIAARKPVFETTSGPKVIDANHATFVFGHLGLYPARVFTMLGFDGSAIAPPAAWTELFKAGVPCQDDPSGTIYPKWDEVVAQYRRGYETVIPKLVTLDDSVFAAEHPDPKVRERFRTLGIAINFLLNNHQMVHLGQVSTWRRCFGLPGVM